MTMQQIRRSNERGAADHGWLKSRHSFSFADYYDSAHMEFGPLRVINEDQVVAGAGFGTHSHRDMEIISYVLSGALSHQDSMGNGSVLRPGDVQRMSAGTGVSHSEFNASAIDPVHFLQIWIVPNKLGIPPSYEEKHFSDTDKRGQLRLIASPAGEAGSVRIHQDARVFAGLFDADEAAIATLAAGRQCYVHLVRGEISVNGTRLSAGDALMIDDVQSIALAQGIGAEVLLFDLPR
jgi:redox-sensitive bicupin YhaK (pirin superfamily)